MRKLVRPDSARNSADPIFLHSDAERRETQNWGAINRVRWRRPGERHSISL
jgi:hypothetical protein